MKNRSLQIIFHLAFIVGFICFIILFYFNIKNIFLTYYLYIMAFILLISKLIFWGSITINKEVANQKNEFLLRLAVCIFIYITPVYCIFQEPILIVNHYISLLTFIIALILTIIGMLIERKLYIKETDEYFYERK